MPETTRALRFRPVLKALLSEGLSARFIADGRSMLPTIRDGDTLLVEPVQPESIGCGDLLVAEYPSAIRAHRVVALPGAERREFLMRGDALPLPDAPVSPERILGRVAGVKRAGRRRPIRGSLVQFRVFLRRTLVLIRSHLPGRLARMVKPGFPVRRIINERVFAPMRVIRGRGSGAGI